MRPHALRSLAVLFAITLASCGTAGQKTDSSLRPHMLIEGIALSDQEQQQLIPLAKAGDADAASRLAHHFLMAVNDEKSRGSTG